MSYIFQWRRGSAAEWAAVNPILRDGEPGIETDTDKFKIGDGITAWDNLTYFIDEAGVTALVQGWTSPGKGDPGDPGPSTVLSIGDVATAPAGANASVSIDGISPNQEISFVIPRGDKGEDGDTGDPGPANSLAIGTVETLPTGAPATAAITGTAPSQELNLGLPAGDPGIEGGVTPPDDLTKIWLDPNGVSEESDRVAIGDELTASVTSGAAGAGLVPVADGLGAITWGDVSMDHVTGLNDAFDDEEAARILAHNALVAEFEAHEGDSTNVHGISDMALLETKSDSAQKMVDHLNAVDPHPQYADPSEMDAKVTAHSVVTTDVHGITNTQNLALKNTIGNLLTANQASGTDTLGDTTGFTATNNGTGAATSSTDFAVQGSKSCKVTTTLASPRLNLGGTSALGTIPVTPGAAYTAVASTYAPTATFTNYLRIYWFTSAGNVAASTANVSSSAVALRAAWFQHSVTGVAPANAAYCSIVLHGASAVSGDAYYVDAFGLWVGAGGDWAMPGTPIVNLGTKVSHPNVDDVLVQRWDSSLARWQTVHYDSGWRQVVAWNGSGNITAGTATWGTGWSGVLAGALQVRRVGISLIYRMPYVKAVSTNPTAPVFNEWTTLLPAAFRPSTNSYTSVPVTNDSAQVRTINPTSGVFGLMAQNAYTNPGDFFAATSEGIPTSLPGTLVSAAPA